MDFYKLFKKTKRFVSILLVGVIMIPYLSGAGLALAQEADRCPLAAITQFNFWDALKDPADALLALIPAFLTGVLSFFLKLLVRVLVFFITPKSQFLGNTFYKGYSTQNEFVVAS